MCSEDKCFYELSDGEVICTICLNKKEEDIFCECITCPKRDTCMKICCLPLLPFSKFKTPRDS